MQEHDTRNWDAPQVLFEIGRQLQAASLTIRKHQVASHQICACGRLAVDTLRALGPRCEVACHAWHTTEELMRRFFLAISTDLSAGTFTEAPSVGRATVYHASGRP